MRPQKQAYLLALTAAIDQLSGAANFLVAWPPALQVSIGRVQGAWLSGLLLTAGVPPLRYDTIVPDGPNTVVVSRPGAADLQFADKL